MEVVYEDWLSEARREALREGEQKGRPKGIAALAALLYGLTMPRISPLRRKPVRQSPAGPKQLKFMRQAKSMRRA